MAYIGKKPSDTFRGLAYKDTFTGDGSTVAFDLTREAPDGGDSDLEIFIDNVRQEGGVGTAYTLGADGSGDTKRVTFTAAPDSGADIYVLNPGRDSGVLGVGDTSGLPELTVGACAALKSCIPPIAELANPRIKPALLGAASSDGAIGV